VKKLEELNKVVEKEREENEKKIQEQQKLYDI
jgi:hypothetical protein